MPSVNIAFQEQGIEAIERSQRGIVALILVHRAAKPEDKGDRPHSSTHRRNEEVGLCTYRKQRKHLVVGRHTLPTSCRTCHRYVRRPSYGVGFRSRSLCGERPSHQSPASSIEVVSPLLGRPSFCGLQPH